MSTMFSDEVYGKSRKSEYNKARYRYLKENGFCVQCGGNKTDGSHVKCLDCRLRGYEQVKFRHKPRKIAPKWVEYKKNLYWTDKAAGICTQCHKRKAVEGKTRCSYCQARQNRHRRSTYITKPKWMCLRCTNNAVDGYKHCQKHLELVRGYAKKGNERITELRKAHGSEYTVYRYWERGKVCRQ